MQSNMSVDPKDFDTVCRICLSKEATQSIFALEHNGISILTFFYCTFLHVDKDDGLPQNLCSVCFQDVIRIHNFQEKCRQNQILLKFALTSKREFNDAITMKREENMLEFPINQCAQASEANKTIAKNPTDSNTLSSCSELSNDKFASSDRLEIDKALAANYSDKICRTCLSIEEIQPIFALKYKEMFIVDLLDSYFVHVERNDGLPQSFCSVCLQEIMKMHDFQVICKQNESMLRSVLTKVELAKQGGDELESNTNQCNLSGEMNKERENKFFCPHCNKGFDKEGLLKWHLEVHTKEKPYTCDVCNESFANPSILNRHLMIHTGYKLLRCHVCNEAFTQSSALNRHFRTHTLEKPYSCMYCPRSFARKDNLKTHNRRMHSGEKSINLSVGKSSPVSGEADNVREHAME